MTRVKGNLAVMEKPTWVKGSHYFVKDFSRIALSSRAAAACWSFTKILLLVLVDAALKILLLVLVDAALNTLLFVLVEATLKILLFVLVDALKILLFVFVPAAAALANFLSTDVCLRLASPTAFPSLAVEAFP